MHKNYMDVILLRHKCKRHFLLPVVAALSLSLTISTASFVDVTDQDWFQPAVRYVVNRGLFGGVGPGKFAPDENMSRAMFYTVLARMDNAAVNDDQGTNLKDVPQGQWYTGSVVWALTTGLTTCENASSFGAHAPVTRVEICLALSRYDRYSGSKRLNTNAIPTFLDIGPLIGEERAAVAACQDGGIVEGRTDGRFDPYAGASRAEVAQMISRYCKLASHPQPIPYPESPGETPDYEIDAKGWTYNYEEDFPLADLSTVTEEAVLELNSRMIYENLPTNIAPLGETIDGDRKHLTNYGTKGIHDSWNVITNRFNKNNEVDEGVELNGTQQYYGYSLQTGGIVRQDSWHETAEESGKDPWQCTWWVWGRAAQYIEEVFHRDLRELCDGEDNFGHGKSYYSGLSDYFVSDQRPTPNSIVSWSCGSYGHVAYVEAVDAGGIWVSMADSGHTWRGITYIPRVDSIENPYPLSWYAEETLNGFNHLDKPLYLDTPRREVIDRDDNGDGGESGDRTINLPTVRLP